MYTHTTYKNDAVWAGRCSKQWIIQQAKNAMNATNAIEIQ